MVLQKCIFVTFLSHFFSQRFKLVYIAILLPFLQHQPYKARLGRGSICPKSPRKHSWLRVWLCLPGASSSTVFILLENWEMPSFVSILCRKKYNLLLPRLIDYWFYPCYKFFNLYDLGYLKEIIDITGQRHLKFYFWFSVIYRNM